MTKADFISQVFQSAGRNLSRQEIEDVVDVLFVNLKRGLKKDRRFHVPGFGTLAVRRRAARDGRNPRTLETIRIPAYRTVVFTPSKGFKGTL